MYTVPNTFFFSFFLRCINNYFTVYVATTSGNAKLNLNFYVVIYSGFMVKN